MFLSVDLKFNFSFGDKLLAKNIIHVSFNNGDFKLAWTKPARFGKIMYSKKRLNAKVWHPRLLFISDGSDLRVYALPNGRINENTMCYLPPYDNLGQGTLCFGNVKRPHNIHSLKRFMDETERAFTHGEFTHDTFLKDWKRRAKTGTKVDVVLTCKQFKRIKQIL